MSLPTFTTDLFLAFLVIFKRWSVSVVIVRHVFFSVFHFGFHLAVLPSIGDIFFCGGHVQNSSRRLLSVGFLYKILILSVMKRLHLPVKLKEI